MPATIPTVEPTKLVAGTSWQWNKTLADYLPSDGWSLTYYALGPGVTTPISAAPNAESTGYEVRQAGSVSDAYPAGTYELVGLVTDGTDTFEVYRAALTLEVNPATFAATAAHDETVWQALKATIEGRATRDQERVQVNGREVWRIPMEEAVRLEGIYRARVTRLRHPKRPGPRGEVLFGRA